MLVPSRSFQRVNITDKQYNRPRSPSETTVARPGHCWARRDATDNARIYIHTYIVHMYEAERQTVRNHAEPCVPTFRRNLVSVLELAWENKPVSLLLFSYHRPPSTRRNHECRYERTATGAPCGLFSCPLLQGDKKKTAFVKDVSPRTLINVAAGGRNTFNRIRKGGRLPPS